MKKIKIGSAQLFVVLCLYSTLHCQATPINFFEPYERIIKDESWDQSFLKIGAWVEDGSTDRARNGDQDKVGALRIYNSTQSSLAMLMGAEQGTQLHTFANSFLASLGSATDDGRRGHFSLTGDVEQTSFTLFARYKLPQPFLTGNVEVGAFLPIRDISVKNVVFCDLTQDVLNADALVKQELTSQITQITQKFGCLNICDTKNSGLGDLFLLLRWMRDFNELKKHIRNVRVVVQAGVVFPTGEEKDEDFAFSYPLGNDGAWAFHIGGHLDIDFTQYFRGGIAVNLLTAFEETSVRRMKTDINQTDFLLLNRGRATKNFGPTWKFEFFAQFQEWIRGLSLVSAYQFAKHDNDTLYPQCDQFVHSVVNSAQSLQEWDSHVLAFGLNLDTGIRWPHWWVKPYFSFFYKLPISGKRSFSMPTFGGQIGLTF